MNGTNSLSVIETTGIVFNVCVQVVPIQCNCILVGIELEE